MSLVQKTLWKHADAAPATDSGPLVVAGLFAGIGGIELGLQRAGHHSALLCEVEPTAQSVLRKQFPDIELRDDVRAIDFLPKEIELIAAGFPCQDLSQAGRTRGIRGKNSGLVDYVFKLLRHSRHLPKWLLIENVPFMLQLDRGRAMTYLTKTLAELGFSWAYRVVDARCFGLPQRRRRVILLASAVADPRDVLFSSDAGEFNSSDARASAYGFYWTEGNRGLGWAVDAVPTLKGGSTVGIPSPPAIWLVEENRIVTPDIRDAERLQGFRANWTRAATASGARDGVRWKLVGNAVSVPMARWIGEQLRKPRRYHDVADREIATNAAWPTAAWGIRDSICQANVSEWPVRGEQRSLVEFLRFPTKPLSERATAGFLSRAKASSLRFQHGFLDSVACHLDKMRSGSQDA